MWINTIMRHSRRNRSVIKLSAVTFRDRSLTMPVIPQVNGQIQGRATALA
jgi:hypothetical protein